MSFAVKLAGATGSVLNYGTITSSGDTGVWLGLGGTVENGASQASISGSFDGVFVTGGTATVANYGTVTGGSDDGVCLYMGGRVENGATTAATGLILGYSYGVEVRGGSGAVANFATIEGTGGSGRGVALFAGGSVSNGQSGSSGGLIEGPGGGVYVSGSAGTIDNFGTIKTTFANGIYLRAGGIVTNNSGGTIAGSRGVVIAGDVTNSGTVINSGTIDGVAGGGVPFFTNGTLINGAGGLIAGNYGVGLGIGATHCYLGNLGTILGTSGRGVYFESAGSVANGAGGLISGVADGVFDSASSANIGNLGTIRSTGATGAAINLIGGGSVSNTAGGLLTGGLAGVAIGGGIGTVVNAGTIAGSGTAGIGVILAYSGSTLVNGGMVTGAGGTAVSFAGGGNLLVLEPGGSFGGGIVNGGTGSDTLELASAAAAGTLSGLGSRYIGFDAVTVDAGAAWVLSGANTLVAGAVLSDAGALTNSGSLGIAGTLDYTGTLTNTGTIDVLPGGVLVDPAGSLFNSGTIAGTVTLTGGGYLDNLASGVISGDPGIDAVGGPSTVVNAGKITGTAASYGTAVYLGAGGSLVNSGMVSALGGTTGIAADLALGGAVSNSAGGVLTGSQDGVDIGGSLGALVNSGAVGGGRDGVLTKDAADLISNSGTITGTASYGVYLAAGGAVTNAAGGTIAGGAAGVLVTHAAGAVANFGVIEGIGSNGHGVALAIAGSTLVNGGTVVGNGGTAVAFSGGGNRLVVDPGAVFAGVVNGGTGSDVLELASAAASGTIGGFGTSFAGFTTLAFDSGAQWLVAGAGTVITAAAITGFAGGDTLDLGGLVANGAGYAGGMLTLTNAGSVVAALTLSTPIANPSFQLTPDGAGGTDLTVSSNVPPAVTAPSAVTVVEGVATAIAGVGISDGDAVSAGETITVRLSDANGLLSANSGGAGGGGTIMGSGSTVLTIVGLLSQVNADLATLADEDSAAAPDTIAIAADDGRGGSGNAGIAVTVRPSGITFSGTYTDGIVLMPGDNPATISGTAYVSNHGTAVYGPAGTVWTVANFGVVEGSGGSGVGIDLLSGGVVTNGMPGLLALPTARPGHGKRHQHQHHHHHHHGQPTLTPAAPADAATITGYAAGVAIAGSAGTVTNFGTIAAAGGSGIAVDLLAGGTVVNGASGSGGLISGASGIVIAGGPGTVENFATVAGLSGAAVMLGSGGLVIDHPGALFAGAVEGGGGALELAAGAASGTLAGLGSQFLGFARVTVDSGAAWVLAGSNTIAAGTAFSDAGASVAVAAGATLVNAGTLDGGGGTAVSFGGSGSLLVADPGAVFVGTVAGGGNGLELAAGGAAGSLSGLGKTIRGFATVTVDPGAVWQIADKPADPPDFVNDGTIIVGKSLLFGAVSADRGEAGTIDLGNGGAAEFGAAADARQSLVFTDNSGTLLIDQPQLFHAAIAGFMPGDTIDLVGAAADGLGYSDGFLTVTEAGAVVARLAFAGDLSAANFTLAPDGAGGTRIGAVEPKIHLFGFEFVYNDGAAYYTGTVADDGSFGYSAGETIAAGLGHYTLFRDGATSEPSGTVMLTRFFSAPAAASGGSFTPFGVSQTPPAGGVGSEAGRILVAGAGVPFSPTLEPSFLHS